MGQVSFEGDISLKEICKQPVSHGTDALHTLNHWGNAHENHKEILTSYPSGWLLKQTESKCGQDMERLAPILHWWQTNKMVTPLWKAAR